MFILDAGKVLLVPLAREDTDPTIKFSVPESVSSGEYRGTAIFSRTTNDNVWDMQMSIFEELRLIP